MSPCTVVAFNTPPLLVMSGSLGRPKVFINTDYIEFLREAGYSWNEISRLVGTSRSTLWRRLKENGITTN